ncbi:heparin cofactor 2-like [Scyliorhinus torazame]|uniref:heparin cofactor 2-like n=1 Tax=Scyliorhinus torazame TaxID=75743 RepID=UPI003B595D8D
MRMMCGVCFVLCSLCLLSTEAAGPNSHPGQGEVPLESNTLTRELSVPELDEYEYYAEPGDYEDEEDHPAEVGKGRLPAPRSWDSLRRRFRGKSRLQRLALLNTDFAFSFYRSLARSQPAADNLVFSPFGLSSLMAMVVAGAGNGTREQISRALGFNMFMASQPGGEEMLLHDIFHKLNHRLYKHHFGYRLKGSSGIYIRGGLEVRKTFEEGLRHYYGAQAQSVDFLDPQTVAKFNRLISKATKGKLQDVVEDIDPQTVMLIYQALHFKGSWEHKFIKSKTAMLHFYTGRSAVVKVPMMYVRATMLATTDHTHECDVISLPYSANASMLLVVPYRTFGLRHIERELSWEMVDNWLKDMTNRTREVYIPKFTLHGDYDLIETFEDLGVTDLFHNQADLSGICEERKLYVSSLKQHVALKVDEEGSEVAAVSLSGFMPLSSQAKFMADHPFLFLIFEHHTQSLLFMGRVMNPLNQ